MTYRVEFTGSAAKELSHIRPDLLTAIRKRIDALADDPRPRAATPLRGQLRGLWRLRVGSYRVIYEIDDRAHVVTVAAIGPRGTVYT